MQIVFGTKLLRNKCTEGETEPSVGNKVWKHTAIKSDCVFVVSPLDFSQEDLRSSAAWVPSAQPTGSLCLKISPTRLSQQTPTLRIKNSVSCYDVLRLQEKIKSCCIVPLHQHTL